MTSEKDPFVKKVKDLYLNMYEERKKDNPGAFQLEFWEHHFSTETICNMPEINGNVLDLGCGTGEIDIWLARAKDNIKITGIDISTVALQIAKEHLRNENNSIKNKIEFYESLIDDLPFRDSTFNCCIISHTLEHIEKLENLFAELYRVLKDKAPIIIIVPYKYNHDDLTHVWHFDDKELAAKMRLYGDNVNVWLSQDGCQIACSMNLRHKPRILGMLRIKNEEKWIERTIEKASKLVEGFVILDDGSSDRTPQICRSLDKVIEYEYQNLSSVDEVRDKNKLLKMALDKNPEWILCLDGDEVLEDAGINTIIREISLLPSDITKIGFSFLYMWDSENKYRVDNLYKNVRGTRLFRVSDISMDPKLLNFNSTDHGGNFHCGSVPSNLPGEQIFLDVRVKHYGYFDKNQREEKLKFYQGKDPLHAQIGYYDHLTGGNIELRSYDERTSDSISYCGDSSLELINKLKGNGNPLWQSALFYSQGVKSHLDIGSNTGNTLKGLDKRNITCIEAYLPAADHLRSDFENVIYGDARQVIKDLLSKSRRFDRITMFDFIEHLDKKDGLELLQNIEKIVNREIVLFVPMENNALVNSDKYKNFMDGMYQNIPIDQHELQSHRAIWTPDEFKQLGYETVVFENIHFEGFHAFFAFKYVFETDKEMFYRRIKNLQKVVKDNPVTEPHSVAKPENSANIFMHLGENSSVINPLLINNPDKIYIGANVLIKDGARIEAVSEYAGEKYNSKIIIDDNTSIELSVHIGAANCVYIGKKVMIAGRVTILDHDHGYENIHKAPIDQPLKVGKVIIEDGAWLGENVVVCKNVTVGKNSVIGANSVVTKSIPPYCVAAGNPAKVIKIYNTNTSKWEKAGTQDIMQKLNVYNSNSIREKVNLSGTKNIIMSELKRIEDYIELGDLIKAWNELAELNQEYPDCLEVLNDLATIKIIQKEYTEALRIIEQIINKEPENVIAIKNLKYMNACISQKNKID